MLKCCFIVSVAFPSIDLRDYNFYVMNSIVDDCRVIPLVLTKRHAGMFKLVLRKSEADGGHMQASEDNICENEGTIANTLCLTSQEFKQFLERDSVMATILHAPDPALDTFRRQIVQYSQLYLFSKVGNKPSPEHLRRMVKIVIMLFPKLADRQNILEGYLFDRVKNVRAKLAKMKRMYPSTSQNIDTSSSNSPEPEALENVTEMVEFLINADVNCDNEKILEYLQATLNHRFDEAKSKEFSVFRTYSLFYMNPNFVSTSFKANFHKS